jgi:predicted Zn-dependent protease
MSYSNLLIAQKRWNDLADSVLLIRHENNPLRDALAGYSYYLEGLAELGRGRLLSATNAFMKIASAPSRNRIWELIIAEKVASLGFAEPAKELLLKIEKDLPDQTEFWLLLAKTAFDLQDPDLLVSALASAHKLRPGNPMIMNNYAAALLATRQRPAEALRLTTTLLERAPDVAAARINHTLALLQNHRLHDAETLVRTVVTANLNPEELTSYHFAWFELHLGLKQHDQARQASERIRPQYLLPTEKQWLEKARLDNGITVQ